MKTDCDHTCCRKIMLARKDFKTKEHPHTHVYEPEDCPSCYVFDHKLSTL